MKILVTGASGLVGGLACRRLGRTGDALRAGYHRRPPRLPDAVEAVALDYEDPDSLRHALEGVTAALFIAPATPRLPDAARAFLAAAEEQGVAHIVKISAYGGDGESFSRLGGWHAAADAVLGGGRPRLTLLRCMPFMQNILYVAETMIKPHRLILLPCGDARVSHVDAIDVAEAACAALRSPDRAGRGEYVITGGEALSYGQIAGLLGAVTGSAVGYRDIPEGDALKMLVASGVPEQAAQAKLASFRLEKENRRSLVTDHVRILTGRAPTPFREFLEMNKDRFC